MKILFNTLLGIHIIAGSLSLAIGLLTLSRKKGDKQHKKIGNIFYISMLVASGFAIPMSFLHPNFFLFSISIFTIYLLLSGKRYLKIKTEKDFILFDKILTLMLILFSVIFIYVGIKNVIKSNNFGIVFIVFGILGALLVMQDYINWQGKSKIKNFGLIAHIGRMIGGYIATVTAFLVVNNTFMPNIAAWLLPTFLFMPLQIMWERKYKVLKS